MAGPPRQLPSKDFLKGKHYCVPRDLNIDSVGQGLLKMLHDTKMGMIEELDLLSAYNGTMQDNYGR
jgi:hypothetical protein